MTHRLGIDVTHLYADGDGDTHFATIEVAVPEPPGADDPGMLNLVIPDTRVVVSEYLKKDYAPEVLHGAPRRQFVVCLRGRFSVTTSGGETREFGPGDWVLFDDVGSKGHITRTVGDERRINVAIGLPDEVSLGDALPR